MLKKNEYIKSVRRQYPLLISTLICSGFLKDECYTNLIKKSQAFCKNIIISDFVWYYAKEEKNKATELAFEAWKNPEIFNQVKNEILEREQKVIETAQEDNFVEFAKAWENHVASVLVIFTEVPVEKKIHALLSEKLSSQEVESLCNEITKPLQDNFHKIEEHDLVYSENLDEHAKKYEWFVARYGKRDPYTAELAKHHLNNINKEEFLKEWKLNKEKLQQSIIRAKEILGEESHIVDFLQFIVYYRTQRTDIMNKSLYLAIPMLDKLASSLELTYEQLLYCTKDEVLQNNLPSLEIINERINQNAILVEDGEIYCKIKDDCEKIRKHMEEEVPETTEIRGSVACQGKANGPVKIIFDQNEFSKLKEGDILVTSMTTPDMAMIMEKAAAFITDEGGITCHAAIIAREMKKPCIIGTRYATKLLHDGDLIEVDADRGLIKIIKKTE
jgi:phosphohistidine swiveling domain-containing protein